MKLKSYFAESVEAAMEQASRELGPDAMLVYSRQAAPESKRLGAYEVVFGTGDAPAGCVAETSAGETGFSMTPDTGHVLSGEIDELKRLVRRLSGSLARSSAARIHSGPMAEPLGLVAEDLSAAGLSQDAAWELVDHVRYTTEFDDIEPSPHAASAIRKLVRLELLNRISTDNRLGGPDGKMKVVAMVGPPGAGKTTALVKLAALHAMRTRRPAQILSADTVRVAAAEQLRSYAAILGVGFQLFDTATAIANALEEHRHKDLVLIDTPGYGLHDLDAGDDLAALLRSRGGIDVHLVLPATMKPADMHIASDRYERFRPSRLLFTKLDETVSGGSIVTECIRSRRPVSFLTAGQQIPEDIEDASRERLVDLIAPGPNRVTPVEELRPALAGERWPEVVADSAAAA